MKHEHFFEPGSLYNNDSLYIYKFLGSSVLEYDAKASLHRNKTALIEIDAKKSAIPRILIRK